MNLALLNLLQLCDPTLPIGGYSHSAGLETYVQLGIVNSKATAEQFVREMLEQNIQFNDAAYMSLAYAASVNGDYPALVQLDRECFAAKLPVETRMASQKLGTRLIKVFAEHCQSEMLSRYQSDLRNKEVYGHYCLVFGLCANALMIVKEDAIAGFYYNQAVGMVTNAVKLIPLGQQQGQQLMFAIQPLIQHLTELTVSPDPDRLGRSCHGFDLRSMQHERLYSRLYMS